MDVGENINFKIRIYEHGRATKNSSLDKDLATHIIDSNHIFDLENVEMLRCSLNKR